MQDNTELDIALSESFIQDLEKMFTFCIENGTDSVEIEFGPVMDGIKFYANVDFYGRKVDGKSCNEISTNTFIRKGESKHSFAKKFGDTIIRNEIQMMNKEAFKRNYGYENK